MKSKSRFFSSLLIAFVAAFGYYILTDFKITDVQLKKFSSLGMPYKMFEINNSVKQKKLPLPKIVYSFSIQQDELKSPKIEMITESMSDADEFIAGLTTGLIESERREKSQQSRISDKVKYGTSFDSDEAEQKEEVSVPQSYVTSYSNSAPECREKSFTYTGKVSKDDIEMAVTTTVSLKNVKKIEECFKKIKVVYGNEKGDIKNVIVNSFSNPNKQTRGNVTCTDSRSTVRGTGTYKVATAESESEDEDSEDEDSDN